MRASRCFDLAVLFFEAEVFDLVEPLLRLANIVCHGGEPGVHHPGSCIGGGMVFHRSPSIPTRCRVSTAVSLGTVHADQTV